MPLFFILRFFRNNAICRQQQSGDTHGVLQGDSCNFNGVDDAGCYQVLVNVFVRVVAERALANRGIPYAS